MRLFYIAQPQLRVPGSLREHVSQSCTDQSRAAIFADSTLEACSNQALQIRAVGMFEGQSSFKTVVDAATLSDFSAFVLGKANSKHDPINNIIAHVFSILEPLYMCH